MYDWEKIYDELVISGCPRDKIILGKAFLNPNFVLSDYLRLVESKCSIICNNCIGGMISEELGIRYLSPTKNTFTGDNLGFCTIVNNLPYYLQGDMIEYPEWITQNTTDFYEKAKWGGVVWEFPHDANISNAVKNFNKKMPLLNLNNIAVIMTLYNDEDIDLFRILKVV